MWQAPNLLLWLWIVLKLLQFALTDNDVAASVGNLSKAVLFAWAYLELTEGESHFRRLLGLVVIIVTSISIL